MIQRLAVLALSLAAVSPVFAQERNNVPPFKVRPGYKLSAATPQVAECRFIELSDDNTLFISQANPGKVVALKDIDGDGVYEKLTDFVSGHKTVQGLDWHDGWLWFTESGAIFRAQDTDGDGKADKEETIIKNGELPSGEGHWFRSICVTNDYFFTSIGDGGNISDPGDTDRQKIFRYKHDGSDKTLWSSGIRNTEKLRLRPGTDELWGADHGSDGFGSSLGETKGNQPLTDLMPPEEFNHYIEGGFYGHPWVIGKRIPRYESYQNMDKAKLLDLVAKTIPPAWEGGAHWANNGFTFLDKDYFPDHKGDAVIAYHGSWNSTKRVGYCIQRILFDKETGLPYGSLTLVSCLDDKNQDMGRPCDVTEAADGTILFSDDRTRRVYRISKE